MERESFYFNVEDLGRVVRGKKMVNERKRSSITIGKIEDALCMEMEVMHSNITCKIVNP